MAELTRARLCRALRPDGRGPGPARRHRPVDRGRAGPHLRRRGGRLRRRQVDPRVDGAGHRVPGRRRARHRHHQRRRARPLGHRAGRRRHRATAGSSPSAAQGTPTSPTACTRPARSAPAPTSSPVRAGSSPPAASTCTCTSCPPARSTRRWPTGLTTLGGGGTGPSEGSKATTVTPGAWHLQSVLRGLDHLPVNVLLMGKGNTVSAAGLEEQALAGAAAYKVHEDWGATPAAIDAALRAADEFGLQVALHSDSLNEAGYVESTLRAIGGRSIHAFHTEGAGGGHAPDIIDHRLAPQRAARVDQPDPAAHRQHRRRAPRHADGLPPPQPFGARGPGLRRVPDPGDDDRGRGHPARHRRAVDDLLRRPGDGPDRRGRHPDLAGRARHEGASGVPRRRPAGRQRAGPALRRQVHDQPGDRARHRRRGRVGRGRQARRPGAVGPEVLRLSARRW